MSTPRIRPIWTPEDAASLRAAADRFPTEIGQAVISHGDAGEQHP